MKSVTRSRILLYDTILLISGGSTSVGLRDLDTCTMEYTVFREIFTLIKFLEFYPSKRTLQAYRSHISVTRNILPLFLQSHPLSKLVRYDDRNFYFLSPVLGSLHLLEDFDVLFFFLISGDLGGLLLTRDGCGTKIRSL